MPDLVRKEVAFVGPVTAPVDVVVDVHGARLWASMSVVDSVGGVNVSLQGSVDGIVWTGILETSGPTTFTTLSSATGAFRYVRVRLNSSLGGGQTATATVMAVEA